ncbi:MAG: metallophosphoesterase [Terracidiphilus sp.]|jgi:predicted MPP superfamily phosphohydrolase
MTVSRPAPQLPITRRRFLLSGACAGAGLALYAGEIERHWIEITYRDVVIPGLPQAFDGFRIAQLSDIHLDEFTEPFFLRDAVRHINRMNPDAVFLTGDYVTHELLPKRFSIGPAWQCANLLNQLQCRNRYAILGNHDVIVGRKYVIEALTANAITVLDNSYLPIERAGSRFWLAGIDDPVAGDPDPEAAIPASIRGVPHEPIVLLCHAPDYVDDLLIQPVGQALSLVLAGHTHGGQIRLPWVGPLALPEFGRKYVEGWFRFGNLQLYVNRGLGTVGIPFRLDCPPEITLLTLRSA